MRRNSLFCKKRTFKTKQINVCTKNYSTKTVTDSWPKPKFPQKFVIQNPQYVNLLYHLSRHLLSSPYHAHQIRIPIESTYCMDHICIMHEIARCHEGT